MTNLTASVLLTCLTALAVGYAIGCQLRPFVRRVFKPDEDELGVQSLLNAADAAEYLGIHEVTLIELYADQRIGANGMTTSGPLFRRTALNEWKAVRENRLILHAYASQTDARIMQAEFGPINQEPKGQLSASTYEIAFALDWFLHKDPYRRLREIQDSMTMYQEMGLPIPEVWEAEKKWLTDQCLSGQSTIQ